jgi:hypothetical protein
MLQLMKFRVLISFYLITQVSLSQELYSLMEILAKNGKGSLAYRDCRLSCMLLGL